jgi:hypothetical protein
VKSLILLLVFAVSSCGRSGDRFDSRTYRIPWPDEAGDLRLQDVEIRTMNDPKHFSGDAARVLVEPGDGGSQLAGSEPQGRYVRTRSGVLIPADFVTMQAVTAYAHTERLRDLDESVGAGGVLSWPLSLGVEVRVMSYGQRATNNAIYDAKLDSLLLVPYDQGGLPIALNPGVLAHEHFHFLFQRLVMSHVRDTTTQTSCSAGMVPDEHVPTLAESFGEGEGFVAGLDRVAKTASAIPARVYNAYVLRGLNEGFADFYGWVYSNDDSFLAKSLPEQDLMRRLDSDSGRLPSERLLRRLLVDNFQPEKILPEPTRARNAYALGSIYARYLRHLVDDLVSSGRALEDARLIVARAMIATLPEIGARMETSYETEFLSPNFVISHLLAHLPPVTSAVCASLDEVHAPEDSYEKPAACRVYEVTPAVTPTPTPTPTPAPVPTPKPVAKRGAK